MRNSILIAAFTACAALGVPIEAQANGRGRYVTPTTMAEPDPPWPAREGVCIAGCDATQYGRIPTLPVPMLGGASGSSHTLYATGMDCHDSGGCRVRGSIALRRHHERHYHHHHYHYGR